MPLYEYQCDDCGRRLERIQKFSDAPLTECPDCSGLLRKLPSSPAFQFKGSGWYITDYARAGKPTKDGNDTKDGAEKSTKDGAEKSTKDGAEKSTKDAKDTKTSASSNSSSERSTDKAPAPTKGDKG